MKKSELLSTIGGLSSPTVLVVGDLILDRYMFGAVERLSPEAPVPVLDFQRDEYVLGGAANVAHNIATVGGRPVVAGLVGEDEQAGLFAGLLKEAGVAVDGLVPDPSRPTIVKTRVIGGHQQICRVDREKRHDVDGAPAQKLRDFLTERIPTVDAVVISDYGKGCITKGLLDFLRELAAGTGTPFVVDPKDTHFSNYRRFTVVTPNLNEASLGAGFKIKDRETLLRAGAGLIASLETKAILITRGPEGMSLFRRDEPVLDIPTRAREVYDVTGAGDTVVSVLAVALASGLDMAHAAHLANWAAGVVVAKNGTATVSRSELADYVERFAD